MAAGEAAKAWRGAWRGGTRAAPVVEWSHYERDVGLLRDRLKGVPPGDPAWAGVAHELAGVFSAWSLATEKGRPGPLAATARTLARSASTRRLSLPPKAAQRGPSLRGVSLILASAGHGGRGPVGAAVLLRQLSNTARALHDAHVASGRAQEAQRVADAVLRDLEEVRKSLPPPQQGEAPSVGARPRTPGSPVPSLPSSTVRATDRGKVER